VSCQPQPRCLYLAPAPGSLFPLQRSSSSPTVCISAPGSLFQLQPYSIYFYPTPRVFILAPALPWFHPQPHVWYLCPSPRIFISAPTLWYLFQPHPYTFYFSSACYDGSSPIWGRERPLGPQFPPTGGGSGAGSEPRSPALSHEPLRLWKCRPGAAVPWAGRAWDWGGTVPGQPPPLRVALCPASLGVFQLSP